MLTDDDVVLRLTQAEALVLFEWLGSNDENLPFADPSEKRVLWNVAAQLECTLVQPFATNYAELLASARAEVRSKSPTSR